MQLKAIAQLEDKTSITGIFIATMKSLGNLAARFIQRNGFYFVLFLSSLMAYSLYKVFRVRSLDTDSIPDLGAYLSGSGSILLVIWLIYSIQIQARELRTQNKIRRFSVGSTIVLDANSLLNAELKNLFFSLGVVMPERSVFDLDEAPHIFLENVVLENNPLRLDTDAVQFSAANRYCEIFEKTHRLLLDVDPSKSTEHLLMWSPYAKIYNQLADVLSRDRAL